MFDKNRVHFMNAYYKETEKPFGYLLVDNKPDTPADQQILADLFGECYVYHFGVNSTQPIRVETKPTRVETKPAGKHSTATKITCSRKKFVQTVTWSNATIPEWQEYTSGAPEVRKIPEGYVIIEITGDVTGNVTGNVIMTSAQLINYSAIMMSTQCINYSAILHKLFRHLEFIITPQRDGPVLLTTNLKTREQT